MPLPLPLKYKRFKNTCPLFFLSPALPRGVKNLKALVDPLHLPSICVPADSLTIYGCNFSCFSAMASG